MINNYDTITVICPFCWDLQLLFISVFCFASAHCSFGKGGTPDSHGLLGKELGKIFFCVVIVISKFILCD